MLAGVEDSKNLQFLQMKNSKINIKYFTTGCHKIRLCDRIIIIQRLQFLLKQRVKKEIL